jgi:hypothetical protein
VLRQTLVTAIVFVGVLSALLVIPPVLAPSMRATPPRSIHARNH